MNQIANQRSSDEWQATTATVVDCRRTLETAVREKFGLGEGDEIPEYVVRFKYKAMGTTYSGTYKSSVPREPGHTIEILYDPDNPEVNTGMDLPYRRSSRIMLRIAGILLALGIVWLCFKLNIHGE